MSGLLRDALAVLAAAGVGGTSALVPLVNAEAYAVAAGLRVHAALALPVVLALALGQTAGKLVLLTAARRGSQRWAERLETSRWTARTTAALRSRRTALPLVLCSAAVGVPPLAVVSLAAGAAGTGWRPFAVACLTGRTARFAALVLPVVWLG